MASSSNSTIASQSNAALPLIPCPLCGSRVLTDVSKGGTRPGTRYYKCDFFSTGQCSFFSWNELYARLMEGNGGQAAGAVAGDVRVAPPAVPQFPRPQQQPDLARANLLLSVTNMMVTFIVLGVLIAILLGHGPQ
uniref:Uncharacterized protein n=1 Tax=Avena sativa TaxID=4498 RepID=A0ACD5UEQ9_AVESA